MGWAQAALAGGSLLSSALGGRGKQKQEQTSTTEFDETQTQTGLETLEELLSQTGFREAIEDPRFTEFRAALLPLLGKEIGRAGKRVFGPAQTAGFMSNLNDLASSSMEAIRGNLARVGALDSGQALTDFADIELNRNRQATEFFRDLPFREEEARLGRLGGLLGLATNFLGRSPLGEFTFGEQTGSRTGTSDVTSTRKGTQKQTGTATQSGPGFLSGLASGAGGLGAIGLVRGIPGINLKPLFGSGK